MLKEAEMLWRCLENALFESDTETCGSLSAGSGNKMTAWWNADTRKLFNRKERKSKKKKKLLPRT